MSSLMTKFYTILIISIFLVSGCKQSGKNNSPETPSSSIAVPVDSLLARKFGTTSLRKLSTSLNIDGTNNFAVCFEPKSGKGGGIVLALVGINQDTLTTLFNSSLLDGSVEKTSISLLTDPRDTTNKFAYYDTGDYLLGSGGGEMYIYIISLKFPELVQAHLIITSTAPPKLYIHPNCPGTIALLIENELRADYPGFQRIKKDRSID